MSTGNNLEEIYSNSIKILKDLIAFKTVSGENNTQLIDYCDNILNSLGAVSFRTVSYTHLTLPTKVYG